MPGPHAVARGGEVHAQQPVGQVDLHLGFGPARLLEVLDVELLVAAHHAEGGAGLEVAAGVVGHADQGERREDAGTQQG